MPRRLSQLIIVVFAGLAPILTLTSLARAATEKILYSFSGTADGSGPNAAVIFDASGNLYGTTEEGGSTGSGVVFKLTPNSGGTWSESVLYSFAGETDGYLPAGSLIFDSAGNLYGTTYGGGSEGGGTVFKLSPTTSGPWTKTILLNFTGPNGSAPQANLIFDAAGNLYGTTENGGSLEGGTVFQLVPGTGGTWTQNILFNFPITSGGNQASPTAGLIFDSVGNLYSTALYGGSRGLGNVFELSPSGTGWTIKNLHAFTGSPDGEYPEASVIFDSAGNLYSTAVAGGSGTCSCGTVLRLKPSGAAWTEQILHSFSYTPGNFPGAGLVLDSANNLYGVAYETSTRLGGSAFKISLTTGAFTTLHTFGSGGDGEGPLGTLIFDSAGNLYGTTVFGGALGGGTVYEITP
ncbi:MAG: choice-of-anchor tandem repeat GloVer-containing protein [Candidatus Sulfotelmatobacter sp.]